MFQVNDTVMYGNLGVCRITDICQKDFMDTRRLYYVLSPVFREKTTIYRPVDNDKIPMRKLLSLAEVNRLIHGMPVEKTAWVENKQQRKDAQTVILRQGDHEELISLIKTLYDKQQEQAQQGKKLYAADENAMREAEQLLYEEFALVLDIEPEEVVPFIMKELQSDSGPAEALQ